MTLAREQTELVTREQGSEVRDCWDSSILEDQLTRLQQMKSHISGVKMSGHLLMTTVRNLAKEATLAASCQVTSDRSRL